MRTGYNRYDSFRCQPADLVSVHEPRQPRRKAFVGFRCSRCGLRLWGSNLDVIHGANVIRWLDNYGRLARHAERERL